MMGQWGYGMMGWNQGIAAFSVVGFLFWLVLMIDLVLAGIWLWKQIQKK